MESHPEYFSLVKGRRVGGMNQGQLCLSNPELRPLILQKLLKTIEDDEAQAKKSGVPAPRLYDLSMNDNGKFCTCENCMKVIEKFGRGGEYLRFFNYFANELAKVHPEILLTTLAYLGTEEPPKGGVRAAKNLVVKLCDTSTSQAISIHTERNKGFRERIEAWKKAADNLFIWDYSIAYPTSSHGEDVTGFPYPSEMYYGEQCRFYRENNVTGIFWEHEYPSKGDLYELKYFLECKMMEDPYQDSDALINLFMDRYYGAAASYALQYRKLLYNAAKTRNANVPMYPTINNFSYITNDDCKKCQAILDKAEAAVKDDRQLFRRVRRLRSGLDMLICKRVNGIAQHGPAFDGKTPLDSKDAARRLSESYVDWFTQYKNRPQLATVAAQNLKQYMPSRRKTPTPERFKGRSYLEYTAEAFAIKGNHMSIVEDSESDVGVALMTEADKDASYKLSFQFGLHDVLASKTLLSKSLPKLPESRGYNWYKVGEAVISADSYIYVTRAWTTQIYISHSELIGKKVEIWLSVKHVGPFFHPDQTGDSRIYIDRAIILLGE